MDEPRAALFDLIAEVSRLCDHVRDLARVETRDPAAVDPVRHAVGDVARSLDRVQALWNAEAGASVVAPASPSTAAPPQGDEGGADASWLLGDDLG